MWASHHEDLLPNEEGRELVPAVIVVAGHDSIPPLQILRPLSDIRMEVVVEPEQTFCQMCGTNLNPSHDCHASHYGLVTDIDGIID